jgi:hypothetical protein
MKDSLNFGAPQSAECRINKANESVRLWEDMNYIFSYLGR